MLLFLSWYHKWTRTFNLTLYLLVSYSVFLSKQHSDIYTHVRIHSDQHKPPVVIYTHVDFQNSLANRQTNDKPLVQTLIGLTTTCQHQHDNKSPTSFDTAFTSQEMDGDRDSICLSPACWRHYRKKDNQTFILFPYISVNILCIISWQDIK